MKLLACTLLALVLALPVRADGDNVLQNGDFADGITHWYGGGRSPADYANDNPLQANDPLTSAGLIIPLHSASWTHVAQDFRGKISDALLTIVYKVSGDFSFSTKPEDYVNMPVQIGYDGWSKLNTPVGDWVVFIADAGSNSGRYTTLKPKTGSSDPQTYKTEIKGLTPLEDKKITLAFPPGNGTLVVLSVSLTPIQ